MNKKILKQLIAASYTKDGLDSAKVSKIASLLRRTELKQYIRAVKLNEQRNTVTVTASHKLDKNEIDQLKKIFDNKKIITMTDPSLLLGLRIQNNDTIYALNLHDELHRMEQYIED